MWSDVVLDVVERFADAVISLGRAVAILGLGAAILGLSAAIVAAPLGYFGAFGQTGSDYFRECWAKSVAAEHQSRREPVAATAGQAVAWAKCETMAAGVLGELGFIFSNLNSDKAVWDSCPRVWDLQATGSEYYRMTVQLIAKSGGPDVLDHVWPADRLVAKVWTGRWPKCGKGGAGHLQPGERKPISTPGGAVSVERTK